MRLWCRVSAHGEVVTARLYMRRKKVQRQAYCNNCLLLRCDCFPTMARLTATTGYWPAKTDWWYGVRDGIDLNAGGELGYKLHMTTDD